MVPEERRPRAALPTGGALRRPADRHDDLQLAAFVDCAGVAAWPPDQGGCRLAQHQRRADRGALRPLHQAPLRRAGARRAARYLAPGPGRGARRVLARLTVARTLTDQAWADICAAAGPHCPDAEARALLSTVLFEEYPVFAYDRKRVAMRNERAKRMLRNLDAFVADYCTEFELTDDFTRADAVANTVLIRPDLWCIEKLRRRAEAVLLYTEVIRRANARRQSNQRAMLYHRLFTAWLDHFDRATLTYSRIKADAPLSGPLVEFILTAMRQILPEG